MQFATLRIFFGAAWIIMGLLWIRRAYVGEKLGALVTLMPSSDHLMNRRERMIALFLGVANFLLGIFQLIFARH
jgi:uncharacterized membrane protein HdeD (DUF308 family)